VKNFYETIRPHPTYVITQVQYVLREKGVAVVKCKEAISLIHDYLDKDIQAESQTDLHHHLQGCAKCHHHFKQLEKADAFVRMLTRTQVPEGLTERVVNAVAPAPKKQSSWLRWAKRHPAVSVAAVFLFVMMGSLFSLWNQDTDLMVKGNDLDHIVIQGDKVIIPQGETINGDLTVENGQIQVDGEIRGNLVVIDGSILSASTANISGDVKSIDQALDWVWYKMNEMFVQMAR
jgi:anti-sigma factor RsiW